MQSSIAVSAVKALSPVPQHLLQLSSWDTHEFWQCAQCYERPVRQTYQAATEAVAGANAALLCSCAAVLLVADLAAAAIC